MRRFAISDIHGCLNTFRKMIQETLKLTKEDELYLLGDYIDRGPDSKGVIDYIARLQLEGYNITATKGNHEQMMLDACYRKVPLDVWLRNGGDSTLFSFGIVKPSEIPPFYIEFAENLAHYLEVENFLFVHAGFDFAGGKPFEDKQAMLWIRNFSIAGNNLGGRVIIHGHNPTSKNELGKSFIAGQGVYNIDAGCVYKGYPGLGYLCALDLDTLQAFFVENSENY